MTPCPPEIDGLLRPLAEALAKEADVLLDLRELLMQRGHPGKCVRCFFQLFQAAGEQYRPRLGALQRWLETHLEISVSGDGRLLEVLPFELEKEKEQSLEDFCLRAIERIQLDRSYRASRLHLTFRYKAAA